MTIQINSWQSIQFINQEISLSYKSCLFSDLIFITNDGKIKCHQVILGLASNLLRKLFLLQRAMNDEDIVILLPELSLANLENVLSCLYNGADPEDLTTKSVPEETLMLLGINTHNNYDVCSQNVKNLPKLEPCSIDPFCVKTEPGIEKIDYPSGAHFLQELCEEGGEGLHEGGNLFSEEKCNSNILDENIQQNNDTINELPSDINLNGDGLDILNREKSYFHCEICHRKFSKQGLLNLHKQQHFSGQAFECFKCPKIFTNDLRLKKHLSKHINMYAINNDFNEVRKAKLELKKNKDTLHSDTIEEKKEKKENAKEIKKIKQNFDCLHCDKKFSQKSHLERHMDKHGDPQYHCNICGRMFKSKKGLEYHIKIHEENFQHKCETCDRAFVTRQKLLMHERAKHTGEKPYVCEVCGMGFTRSDKLTVHKRRLHTGERPYQCIDCDWAGVDSSSLIHHKKKHTSEAIRYALGQTMGRKMPGGQSHQLVKQEFNKQLLLKREEQLRDAPDIASDRIEDINTHAQQAAVAMQFAFPAHMEQFKYYYQNKF